MSRHFKNFLIILISVISLFSTGYLFISSMIKGLPSISKLEDYTPNLVTKLYDINGELIDEFFIERRTLVPLSKIPDYMKTAILAIEDDKFYSHWGISPVGIMRAAFSNFLQRRYAQGGSTITQQLAKSIFLTREKTFKRKFKEILLALQLEYNYSKDEILQMYLNQIYFGHGSYGISSAAKLYFNKPVEKLNLEECAMLAGLPKAPSYYSPLKRPNDCINRRNLVINRMLEMGFIDYKTARGALLSPLGVIEKFDKTRPASYFVEYIRQQLEQTYGSTLYMGGLKIYTTLDLSMQKAAEKTIETHLAEFDQRKSLEIIRNLKKYTTSYTKADIQTMDDLLEKTTFFHKAQGAIIAIDPRNGQIRTMVGGRNFEESQFNRVTQAKRQPGSAFKPFIYTAAIDNGWTAVNMLDDLPCVYYNNGNDWELIAHTTNYNEIPTAFREMIDFDDPMKIWTPNNYTNEYLGKIILRRALEGSINLCAIQLLKAVGPSTAAYYAKKMGIKSKVDPYLSMALGSFVVTPLEITNAFCTIANQGVKTEPYAVIKVFDNQNTLLEEHFSVQREVISAQTAYIMTNLLKGVIQNGTGGYARRLRRIAAGKTGTTNDFTDAWFIGFTPQLVASVWIGYDNYQSLGDKMAGGVIACPIWTDFMIEAVKNKPDLDFPVPQDITFIPIDPKTGLRAFDDTENAYLEVFLKGTEPSEFSFNKSNKQEDSQNKALPDYAKKLQKITLNLIKGTTLEYLALSTSSINVPSLESREKK
ncbi:MAG: PBP1A family penicillin-binding protein [Elusimicrobiota bacterium]